MMSPTFTRIPFAALAPAPLVATAAVTAVAPADLDRYDTVFDSPSKDESGSIPLGNGEVGINLWVEEDGDLMFYVARNDAVAETITLLKSGRVRVHLDPSPFRKGMPYRQHLRLRDGSCEIVAGPEGAKTRVTVVVDSGSSDVRLRVRSEKPTSATVSLFNWRSDKRDFHTNIGNAVYPMRGAPSEVDNWIDADRWDLSEPDAVVSYHRNAYSVADTHVKWQGMEKYAEAVRAVDPIRDNTFGVRLALRGVPGERISNYRLRSKAASKDFEIIATAHGARVPDAPTWVAQTKELAAKAAPFDAVSKRTAAWWGAYWNRSWLFLEGDLDALPKNDLPLALGRCATGGGGMAGEFGRASAVDRTPTPAEIGVWAATPRDRALPDAPEAVSNLGARPAISPGGVLAGSEGMTFPAGFAVEAWVKPAGDGRIWDKCRPGSDSGLTFDINGGKLRLIAGSGILLESPTALPVDTWTHVAAAVSPGAIGAALYVNGVRVAEKAAPAEDFTVSKVTRAYVLNKYQLACQMRSSLLANFQGGLFRMDPKLNSYALDYRDEPSTPDDQFYGNSYWWQNTRFLYQPQMPQGSRDFYRSMLKFMNRLAPVMRARAEKYYGAKGIYFEECFSPFGLPTMGDFGWGAKEYSEPYARWTWQHGLEASVMMLDDYAYTRDAEFARTVGIPYAESAMSFFETRFGRDAKGRIRVFPTHVLETYWNNVVNDTPSVAGMHYVVSRLLALPEGLSTPEQRARWKRWAAMLPPVPMCDYKGKRMPDNAEVYEQMDKDRGRKARANYEAGDLYTVFPFRVYGLDIRTPDIREAINAYEVMPDIEHSCWNQYGIFSARLGLAENAKHDVVERASTRMTRTDKPTRDVFRFPGFMGSPHDAMPDYDGPGNMMTVLQEMLLQNGEHDELMLLQAWPRDWNAKFKLHAYANTVVEGEVRGGRLVSLKVEPESRRKDVVLPAWAK